MDNEFDIKRALVGKKKGGRFENWKFHTGIRADNGRPGRVLKGDLYGDDRWADGMFVTTSCVVEHYIYEGIVETDNTYYVLGSPLPTQPILTEEEKKEKQKEYEAAVDLLSSCVI